LTGLEIPDYIIITVYFGEYSSRIKRNIPNDTRRCLMGLGRAPNLPQKVNDKMAGEFIMPYDFSLVKGEHEGPKGMTKVAVGATTKYRYVGASEKLKETVDQIRDVCHELRNSESLKWSKFEVYLARRVVSE
jgi:hypothetical protein